MDYLKELQKPFSESDIEWRLSRSGKKKDDSIWAFCLAYITNRAIMERLDEVFGVMGWKNEYREWHNDSQLCKISIWDSETNQWISKEDGADNTSFEATKGGLSDSMKRAAVHFGIGRYLYNLVEGYADIQLNQLKDFRYAKTKNEGIFYWRPPQLPNWALPKGETPKKRTQMKLYQKKEAKNRVDRNFTKEAAKCKTVKELGNWWNILSSKEKNEAEKVKNERKRELAEENQEPDILQLEGLINDITDENSAQTVIELIEINRIQIPNYTEIATLYNEKIEGLKLNNKLKTIPF